MFILSMMFDISYIVYIKDRVVAKNVEDIKSYAVFTELG